MNTNKGSLILKALSPDADQVQIIAYLEKRAKSIPPQEIPQLLKKLPVVLSRNVTEETGQRVIRHLQELGGIALFVPVRENSAKPLSNPMLQRLKQFNKEVWIVLSMLAIAWMLDASIASRYLLLGFYSLPTVVSAYLFGRRQAVFTAFGAILLVGLVSYYNPGRFDGVNFAGIGGANQWYHIVSWGCILLVTAYAMGTLYERNKRKMEELRRTYQGLLLILHHFIAQDEAQENHCFRVSIYASRIASAMGLEKEVVEDIRSAALLHDLGHLKISRSILRKAARINRFPATAFGEQAAEDQPFSDPMGRILPMLIGCHGQPDHAAQEEFFDSPLGARILAVADAYDILITGGDRQPPLSPMEAKTRILADTDSGFDPEVVRAFAGAVDRLDLDLPSIVL
ncbi:MAG: HD-GYP domain-containing protein [Desulfobulbus sp.]